MPALVRLGVVVADSELRENPDDVKRLDEHRLHFRLARSQLQVSQEALAALLDATLASPQVHPYVVLLFRPRLTRLPRLHFQDVVLV